MNAARLRVCLYRIANATVVVASVALIITIGWGVWLARHRPAISRNVSASPAPAAPSEPIDQTETSDKLQKQIDEQSGSPYESRADFAKYSMKLREQALVNVEPLAFVPVASRPATARYPWKTNIVTTVFWIGEKQTRKSTWDANWESNYGGFDNPKQSARRNYIPVSFVPRQNPFYFALPYNDVTHGQFKPEAPLVIPWFKQAYQGPGVSVCKDRWVAIRKGNRTCYAEWEDCGPFRTDHFQYVFQGERPKSDSGRGAGLNVSPAVRDYLELEPPDVTDWQFVEVRDVPPGPWRSYGENNHFVLARRQMEQKLQETGDKTKN